MNRSYYYYHYSRSDSRANQSIAYVACFGLICLLQLVLGAVAGLIKLLHKMGKGRFNRHEKTL